MVEYEFKRILLARERAREREHDYLAYHRKRFNYVFELCKRELPERTAAVLDVSRSQLSYLLASYYKSVVTLGFLSGEWGHERGAEGREPDGHIEFDLNDVVCVEQIANEQTFDLIVFAETIEHLHAAPELVLGALRSLLKPTGLIVCQTPNAAELHKRVKLLLGVHPYEQIRIDERNPGHFRECTKSELIEISGFADLSPVRHEYVEYFGPPKDTSALVRTGFGIYRALSLIVPSFRRGQTIPLRLDQSGDPARTRIGA